MIVSRRDVSGVFALGALGVLVDALLTYRALAVPGHRENHGPVRLVLETLGVAGGLVAVSVAAIAVMAVLALAAVRARPELAERSALVLALAVGARVGVIFWNLEVGA